MLDPFDTNIEQMMTVKCTSHNNCRKPFNMSYRRLLSIIFTVCTMINIISMVINSTIYLNRIGHKETVEMTQNNTNRDAYAVARFINFITLLIGIAVRISGLIAIGVCGKDFSDTEFESSERRESFTVSLIYTCSMIILFAGYYVGVVRMVPHDLILHCVLTIIGVVFIGFSLQSYETYSKELNTLPI